MKNRTNLQIMWKLIGLVKPLMGYMVLAITMGFVGHLCATFITVFGGYALLKILKFPVGFSFGAIFVSVVIFAVARGFLRYAEQACNHFIAFKLLALIRDKVFQALRKLCPAKLEGRDKGNLISVITSDIELLELFYAHTISPAAIAFLFSLILCIYIGSFHVVLGFIALVAYVTIGVIVPVCISKRSGEEGILFRTKSGELSGYVLDSLRGLSETLQYGAGMKRLEKMNASTDELSAHEKKMKSYTGQNVAITNTLILMFDLAVLFGSAMLYIEGEIGFGGVLLPTITLMGSFGPVVALANLGSTLQNTLAAGDRVIDILEESPVVEEIKNGSDVVFENAEVKNVTFAYDSEMILSDVSLKIEKRNVVGIVGKSGSGKSTLLKLLMRFWEADSGEVCISDENVNAINTTNLRQMESYMTQETHLFHDSIANNLRIANLEATQEEIETACKKASIHEFILSLPDGYDTQVGELGDTLSGGEKQRIGLARAFLHKAPLMLLDEPTSNLDSLNEGIILKSLREEKENKTVILISHRESTMRIADQIYQMADISANGGHMS
ncbi:MAG: amino acid ABC transporter ATP-binding/permease protein [Dorea sp.]